MRKTKMFDFLVLIGVLHAYRCMRINSWEHKIVIRSLGFIHRSYNWLTATTYALRKGQK